MAALFKQPASQPPRGKSAQDRRAQERAQKDASLHRRREQHVALGHIDAADVAEPGASRGGDQPYSETPVRITEETEDGLAAHSLQQPREHEWVQHHPGLAGQLNLRVGLTGQEHGQQSGQRLGEYHRSGPACDPEGEEAREHPDAVCHAGPGLRLPRPASCADRGKHEAVEQPSDDPDRSHPEHIGDPPAGQAVSREFLILPLCAHIRSSFPRQTMRPTAHVTEPPITPTPISEVSSSPQNVHVLSKT